MNSSVVLMML